MKVFIAGIMQGNKKEYGIHSQGYRSEISKHLQQIILDIKIIDPDKTDPERLSYDQNEEANMFFKYCSMAGKVDLMISYIPEASMGSAIEMWIAYKANVPIVSISPLTHNWVIKLLSKKIYSDLDSFKNKFNFQILKELDLI